MEKAPVPWRAVFGNEHPVELEIGPGRGEAILAFATAAPGTNFFGIERAGRGADAIMAKAAARLLPNVRVIGGDARCVITHLVPDGSVAAYHIYFPDPWPKRRHHERRLGTDAFARELVRTLATGGVVHLASDLRALVDELAACLARGGLVRVPGAALPVGRPVSPFERKYAGAGTHYVRLVRPPAHEKGAPAPVAVDG
jgi:tRNA (guanine-N7-)-methyltransferase